LREDKAADYQKFLTWAAELQKMCLGRYMFATYLPARRHLEGLEENGATFSVYKNVCTHCKADAGLGLFRPRPPAPVFYALLHAGEGGAFVPAGSICRLSLMRSFNATCAAASLAMGTRNGEQLT